MSQGSLGFLAWYCIQRQSQVAAVAVQSKFQRLWELESLYLTWTSKKKQKWNGRSVVDVLFGYLDPKRHKLAARLWPTKYLRAGFSGALTSLHHSFRPWSNPRTIYISASPSSGRLDDLPQDVIAKVDVLYRFVRCCDQRWGSRRVSQKLDGVVE